MASHIPPHRVRQILKEEGWHEGGAAHCLGARVDRRLASEPRSEASLAVREKSPRMPDRKLFAPVVTAILEAGGWSEGRVNLYGLLWRGGVEVVRLALHPDTGWIVSVRSVRPLEASFDGLLHEVSQNEALAAELPCDWIFGPPAEGPNWRFTGRVKDDYALYTVVHLLSQALKR